MSPDRPTQDQPIEERLRAALSDRAAHIEPAPGGLDRIEEKLMSDRSFTTNQKWILTALSAAAVVLLVVIGVVVLGGNDNDDTGLAAGSSTTSTTDTSTTTSTTEPTSTTFTLDVDPYGVAFPAPTTSQRFDSAEAVARSYATDVLGFSELEMGDYQAGDSRSGEIPITDRPGHPETTIFVRQMGDDHWYVLGSVAPDITVDSPAAGDTIASPFDTDGTALAFEGTVNVTVMTQADLESVGESFVMGSGTPPAGPFQGSIDFDAPTEDAPGIVIYRTESAEDGHILQATSFPVRLHANLQG